jgi:hypothetical protein
MVHRTIRLQVLEQPSRRVSPRLESIAKLKAWKGFCDKTDLLGTSWVEAERTSTRLLALSKPWP